MVARRRADGDRRASYASIVHFVLPFASAAAHDGFPSCASWGRSQDVADARDAQQTIQITPQNDGGDIYFDPNGQPMMDTWSGF